MTFRLHATTKALGSSFIPMLTVRGDKGRMVGAYCPKGAKPIIDVTGVKVAEAFGTGTHVTVTYRAGRITIKRLEA